MKSSVKIVWKTKIAFLLRETLIFFLEQKHILFSETYFLKTAKNLITSAFFTKTDTKKHVSEKASNAGLVKLTDWIIKNDHVIYYAMSFYKWFQHGQTSNITWISTIWLLIFWLEVANKSLQHKACQYMNWNFLLKRYNFLQLQNLLYTLPQAAM